MVNWIEKLRMKREARARKGQPLAPAERDLYKHSWGQAGLVIGTLVAKMTGKQHLRQTAEKTAEKYGEHVADRIDRRIAERNPDGTGKR